jgi:NADH-quinone oxidoreductase subunit E
MIEAGKFLLNRLIGWWDGLTPGEQKVYGGIWAVGFLLLLVTAAEESWPMIVALGAIGGYFFNEWRKARGATDAGGATPSAGDAAKTAARSMADQARSAAATVSEKASAAAKAAPAAVKPKSEAKPKAAAKPKAEPKAKAAPKAAAKKADGGPERLSKPRGGKADDLKMLKGVGPRLETILNEMGFYHYDQIAAWTPDQVAMIDAEMTGVNKGRASRDGWVAQAKILASGGSTEFAKRVADGEVPTSQG